VWCGGVRGSRFFISYLEEIFRRGREQKLKSESERSSSNPEYSTSIGRLFKVQNPKAILCT